jgi:hypothetical protein
MNKARRTEVFAKAATEFNETLDEKKPDAMDNEDADMAKVRDRIFELAQEPYGRGGSGSAKPSTMIFEVDRPWFSVPKDFHPSFVVVDVASGGHGGGGVGSSGEVSEVIDEFKKFVVVNRCSTLVAARAAEFRAKAESANIFDGERIKFAFAARELEKLAKEIAEL